MSKDTNKSQADALKKELLDMEASRKKIENELVMHKVILESNKVGMNDRLVDVDGFPRNDIDIYAVRHARNNIIRLENDAKELFNNMKDKLEHLHSLSKKTDQ